MVTEASIYIYLEGQHSIFVNKYAWGEVKYLHDILQLESSWQGTLWIQCEVVSKEAIIH